MVVKLGQQYNVGEKPTVMLCTCINRHAGTPDENKTKIFLVHNKIGLYSVCVCVCVFFPFILDIKFVGHTSRGHTGGRSHRIFHPPFFCGACLNFSREKDSAFPFPRQP